MWLSDLHRNYGRGGSKVAGSGTISIRNINYTRWWDSHTGEGLGECGTVWSRVKEGKREAGMSRTMVIR